MSEISPGEQLARFAASLRVEAIPASVIERAQDLMIDWLGSALAGKGARPVESIARFAEGMGPAAGPSEVLIHRRGTTPLLAAMVNAASSHVAEQATCTTLPCCIRRRSSSHRRSPWRRRSGSGSELLTAAVAGYEVGIRVGEFLGRSHYKIFHTTGTAGTLAAAAAAGQLLRLSDGQMAHAFGSAGTQAAGLADFDAHWRDHDIAAFRRCVVMRRDAEVDAAYPARWIGKVEVETRDGRAVTMRIDEAKGDPGNTLSRTEIEDKAVRLAAYRGAADAEEMGRAIERIRALRHAAKVGPLLPR